MSTTPERSVLAGLKQAMPPPSCPAHARDAFSSSWPQRDWIREDDFDLATADFNTPANQFVEQFRGNAKAAEMFLWLCGEHETFQNVGGQSWPTPAHRLDKPYGLPEALSDS